MIGGIERGRMGKGRDKMVSDGHCREHCVLSLSSRSGERNGKKLNERKMDIGRR